jgi:hypothetical protein
MNRNIISELFQSRNIPQPQALSFKPGQILNGKILKLYPNSVATLQVGSQKVVAQLEASLEANENYWFQVQPGEGKVRLKLMGKVENKGQNEISLSGLMKELSIPLNKENSEVIRFFLKENLPISKGNLQQTVGILKESSAKQADLEAIKYLVMKELPLTKMTLQSVTEVSNKDSVINQLQTLKELLLKSPLTQEGSQLLKFLDRLSLSQQKEPFTLLGHQASSLEGKSMLTALNGAIGNTSSPLAEQSLFGEHLKGLMKSMGYSYEHEVVQFLKHPEGKELLRNEELKPLLIDFLNENSSGAAKEVAEKMLHRITGLQLLAQESGPIQQFVVQLPLSILEKQMDLTIQWSGRKKENGQIDPSFCRVLFYLELENLHDTIVDMQVQNRILKITVMNENEYLKQLAAPFIKGLKENLKRMNYTLSTVEFTHPVDVRMGENKKSTSYFKSNQYSGVDVRI